jgi:hypothetical protein
MQKIKMSCDDINSIEIMTEKIYENLKYLGSIGCDQFFKDKLIVILQNETRKREIIQRAFREGGKKRYFNKSLTFLTNNIYRPRCLL